MAVVSSVADLEGVLGLGVPGFVIIRGAESVRASARMMDLLGPILDDDAWNVDGADQLRSVASLADNLLDLADDVIPALALNPADAELLRRLNDAGKEIRRTGKELRGFGLSLPEDAGALACTLGNKIHKLVSLAFNERGSGAPRSEVDRGRYVDPRCENLLDQVMEVLDVARVRFE